VTNLAIGFLLGFLSCGVVVGVTMAIEVLRDKKNRGTSP
jgi:hypothetical protein